MSTEITPLEEKAWWTEETFIFELLVLQGDFIHATLSKMKIMLQFGGF